MNLEKLFKAQQILRDKINYNEPDRFEKLVLALLVEIGECANCWRGFKFWSEKQLPSPKLVYTTADATKRNADALRCGFCTRYIKKGEERFEVVLNDEDHECPICKTVGMDVLRMKNPLLEEYVDCLHFILELGIEKRFDVTSDFSRINDFNIGLCTEIDTTWQFIRIHQAVMHFWMDDDEIDDYEEILLHFIGLSKHLRFTWEQVENAYFAKNQINHSRQENGY